MIRRPPRSTQSRSSAASDVYKRQDLPGHRAGPGDVRRHHHRPEGEGSLGDRARWFDQDGGRRQSRHEGDRRIPNDRHIRRGQGSQERGQGEPQEGEEVEGFRQPARTFASLLRLYKRGGQAMSGKHLTLSVLWEPFAICRLPVGERVPEWALTQDFFSITRTFDELSLVCP